MPQPKNTVMCLDATLSSMISASRRPANVVWLALPESAQHFAAASGPRPGGPAHVRSPDWRFPQGL